MDRNNNGYMTIEASFIVPLVLFGIFLTMLGLVFICEKSAVQASVYRALYTIPLNDIRNKSVADYLSGQNYTNAVVLGTSNVDSNYTFKHAKCNGYIDLYGASDIEGDREIDCLVERLRRWQFYDDFAEEQGYE